MTVNELFLRSRNARVQRSIPLAVYTAMVDLLFEEEKSIFSRAAKHNYTDITEANYWHRGQLKFPSRLATGQRLLKEGQDPATGIP
jgi:5-methylcytosine-specific restriction endonuclease McrBC regulatory subunit McrC